MVALRRMNMNKADIDKLLRKVNDIVYNMDLDEYLKLFPLSTEEEWHRMCDNFFSWYCRLDSVQVDTFITELEEKP